jgi:hypothetical protein
MSNTARHRCNHHDGPHRDAPGEHCPAAATTSRTSGEYQIPVCDAHASGPRLWKLGGLFYGFDHVPAQYDDGRGHVWTFAAYPNHENTAIEALFAVARDATTGEDDPDMCWSLRDVNTPQTAANLARAAQAFHDMYDESPTTETGRWIVHALRSRQFCILERPARIAATEPERSRALRDVTTCEMSEDDRRILARVVIVGRV